VLPLLTLSHLTHPFIAFQHFGSPEHHFFTISSPLATQIPQAAGVGYALKRSRPENVAVCYFGEGAASEGDFHAGLALASTVPSPVVFFARNNGFAISTPAAEQYHGDGIASRGPAYGIDTVRVDGNDVLAVYGAVQEARRRCLEQGRAVLVEASTYRVGHHSTSDDSFAYRSRAEVEDRKKIDNPHVRLRAYLTARGWWSAEEEEELKTRLKVEVLDAFKKAEKIKRHRLEEMFGDVYDEMPWNLVSIFGIVRLGSDVSCRRNRRPSLRGCSRSMGTPGSRGRRNSRSTKTKAASSQTSKLDHLYCTRCRFSYFIGMTSRCGD